MVRHVLINCCTQPFVHSCLQKGSIFHLARQHSKVLSCFMAGQYAFCALALVVPMRALRTDVVEATESSYPWMDFPVDAEHIQAELQQRLALGSFPEAPAPGNQLLDSSKHDDVSSMELLHEVRVSWAQGGGREGCKGQLGGLLASLAAACEEASPEEHYVFKYYKPKLPQKTCAASSADLFIFGQRLVEALQVPEEEVVEKRLTPDVAKLVQSLYFLRSWLVPLATARQASLLWAGFWDGDPKNRTTLQTLSDFAAATDHQTVHPTTELGRLIELHGELSHCYASQTRHFMDNMWSFSSMAFVMGMKAKTQGTVVALVNKAMDGPRALQDSVLFQHELPTLGVAAWGLGFWAPQVLLLDLQGTCNQTSPALRKQLFARLTSWWQKKQELHWSSADYARRSRLEWKCVHCPPPCRLDSDLAQHVSRLIQAGVFLDDISINYRVL